ncbi:hypothetical protein LTR05_003139 [Lithohypha guttulata]|uniref:FAD-binding domain-containing protein n=1 Tax=Lithohypha guttulata TaxID=1690604 RepID=A0AAN7T3D3_9EURO|nr:hypothetical protein LTR05_003139 [Lithohypha guttulata]
MKVIIIGGGLSGLSSALALRKYITNHPLEIKVYDKPDHAESSQRRRKLGAGLGLQSNGLRVLDDLNTGLREKVYNAGFPCDHFIWKTSSDFALGREYVDVLPISRPFLVDCLMQCLPEDMIVYKTISRVKARDGARPVVNFEDGSPPEVADLVIGADGVGSIVRTEMFANGEAYDAQYSGMSAVGGVLNLAIPQHLIDDPSMIFVMGSGGNFGYTGLTQSDKNKLLFWSIFKTPLLKRGLDHDYDLLHEELRERHRGWTDPLIDKCIEKAAIDNVYPVFVMPALPYWGKNGCVLVGDAAHALPPRSGQGSSQAFEDGQTLALLVAGYLERHDTTLAIDKSIASLYNLRHARIDTIRTKALAWADPDMPMPQWKLYALYAFIFIMVRVNNLTSHFHSIDKWDARVEVKKHFSGAQ